MARAAPSETGSDARERILEAALEAFSENGFDGARTRDIARRAGVTLGLLQYYFGSKLELWKAAVDLAFAALSGGLESILADPAPADERERMRLLIGSYVRFVAENPEFVRLMHDEGKRRGPRSRWLVDRHVAPLFARLLPLIESIQAKGVLPAGIAPVHLVYALVGAVGIIFHQAEECRRLTGVDPTEEAAVEAHVLAIESLFLGRQEKEDLP